VAPSIQRTRGWRNKSDEKCRNRKNNSKFSFLILLLICLLIFEPGSVLPRLALLNSKVQVILLPWPLEWLEL
jgi:hypothetical protein